MASRSHRSNPLYRYRFCSVYIDAHAIFALFALLALGAPRTGVLVAFETANAPLNLPLLLSGVAIAAATGFVLVLVLGDRYLATVGRVDYTRLSLATLGLLVLLAFLFGGAVGVAAFAAATVVGLVPARLGGRRAHLMGVLMGPLVLAG